MRPLEGFQSSRYTDSGDAKMFLFALFHFFLESFSGDEVAPSRQGGNDEEDEGVKKKKRSRARLPSTLALQPKYNRKEGFADEAQRGKKVPVQPPRRATNPSDASVRKMK